MVYIRVTRVMAPKSDHSKTTRARFTRSQLQLVPVCTVFNFQRFVLGPSFYGLKIVIRLKRVTQENKDGAAETRLSAKTRALLAGF